MAATVPYPAEAAATGELIRQAVAYEHGEGVPQDYGRAADLYCQAAWRGDAEAQYALGWMYANGRGVPHDDAIAARLMTMAAGQGHEHARKMLRYLGDPAPRAPRCFQVLRALAEERAVEHRATEELAAPKHVVELVNRLAPEYNVHPRLALAVIRVESNFDPKARSPKNAQGLMQLIPETSARFNVRNPYDPVQNVRGGLAYLRWLLAYFKGNVALVAAGYNAGEGAVERFRGIPPYRETQGYVKRVLRLFDREHHPYDPGVTEPSPQLSRFKLVRNR